MDRGDTPELKEENRLIPHRESSSPNLQRKVAVNQDQGVEDGGLEKMCLPPLPRRLSHKRVPLEEREELAWRGPQSTVIFGMGLGEEGNEILRPEPLMLVDVRIEGKLVEAMIDTGAQFGLLDEGLAETLGLVADEGRGLRIRGVGRGNLVECRGLVNVDVEIHGKSMKKSVSSGA